MAQLTRQRTHKLREIAPEFTGFKTLARLMEHIGAASPYLARQFERNQDWMEARLDHDYQALTAKIMEEMRKGCLPDQPYSPTTDFTNETEKCASTLRLAKSRIAAILALFELSQAIDAIKSARELSHFADQALECALGLVLAQAHFRGKLPGQVMEKECGIFALAMGKQGAFELNFSSDIDLIFFFDETRFEEGDLGEIRRGFIWAIQRLVKILSEHDSNGYVFRTDLRLRPDPSVTPIVIGADQAESYYEALGRTWERAAMIKARPCAGDIKAGEAFLARLHPFIWRKHLDFAAIEDAHNMRLRIRQHKELNRPIALEGHHLKLGFGGIREIEFFTQTRQLIFGGRNEALRARATLDALGAMAREQVIPHDLADYLGAEYRWLRRLEHALQMMDDRQTHIIPENEEDLERLFCLLNISDPPRFKADFEKRVGDIHATMEAFFAGTSLDENESEGLLDAASGELVEAWMSLPALRSERGRGIFARLRPRIFKGLAASGEAGRALGAFDRFLRSLPSGVQLFSLFEANPALLDLLTEICAIAPREARFLGENSQVLEAVLAPGFFDELRHDDHARLALQKRLDRELANASEYEDKLNAVRRFVREEQFRVSVHLLRNLASPKTAGQCFSVITEIAVSALFGAARLELERRYGKIEGPGAAIMAMGKLGSREMTRSSDLDLVVIYDCEADAVSDGPRQLSPSAYYSRFTQILIQALTVPTSEGTLFEVDMRLRPSGRQGPVAISLSAFAHYQENDAWVWEHLALSRARVICGEGELPKSIEAAAKKALGRKRSVEEINEAVHDMRTKIRDNFAQPGAFSLKYGKGRLMEAELYLQALALTSHHQTIGNSCADYIELIRPSISAKKAAFLSRYFDNYLGLTQLARLSFVNELPEELPAAWLLRQQELSGAASAEELSKHLDELACAMDAQIEAWLEGQGNDDDV